MPAVNEIAAAINDIAPFNTQEEWDNSGILVDCGGVVDSVLVALDVTDDVLNEAQAAGCQLIIAHHPVIFKPVRHVSHGDTIYRCIKMGISAICAHTNLDGAKGGVNDILAAIFGIAEPAAFAGVGRVGRLKEPTTAAALAEKCATKLSAHVRYVDGGKTVNTLAVLGGSGGSLLQEALDAGADCVITGEADHHDAHDARHEGVSLVVAGHFNTEFPVVPVLADYLKKQFPVMRVVITRRDKDPFTYYQ